jgi:prepilin-type N-terminal cleavage/methylation domain-containing protein
MKNRKQKKEVFFSQSQERGFTLIELLIYIAVLGMMLVGVGGTAWNVMAGGERASVIEEISANGRFALNRITEAVREAEGINSPAIGSATTTLSLVMGDPEKDPTVFSLNDQSLTIKRGGEEEAMDVTSRIVKVTDLEFANVSSTGTPGTVSVKFVLSQRTSSNIQEYMVERRFQTTINLFPK